MRSPHQGRSSADSSPDFDGIEEQVAPSGTSWSHVLGDSSSDAKPVLGQASSGSMHTQREQPLVADSHVLAGSHHDSLCTGSSEMSLLTEPASHRKSTESSSPLDLQPAKDGKDAGPILRRTRQDFGSPPHSNAVATGKRHRMTLILLASYASAVTLACLYLVLAAMQSQSNELENLPDVKPLDSNEFRYVPENASLPPGHTLPLGQPQQFGHILVEPLRITREPLEFVHFSGDEKLTRAGTSPVLKLWVRLTNLSDDQLIAPLDRTLLFKRDFDEENSHVLTNNFIHSNSAHDSNIHMLDHPLSSEWDIRDQQLGIELKPGESVVTFLPSETDDIDQLDGQSIWRMHLRKGFNDVSGHGVTTVVDVEFDTRQIEDHSRTTSSG